MNNFARGFVDVEMLGPEWRHRMIDVCGVGVFKRTETRDAYITHLDHDHLPLREYIMDSPIRFLAAPAIVKALEAVYGNAFTVEEHHDTLELVHTTISRRRIVERRTYAYFLGNAMIVPECDEPDALIMEYRPKYAFLLVSYQSHNHPVGFNNHRRDVFIVHNKVWKPYAPNVIPKIVFSLTEEDRDLYLNYMQHV